VTLAHHAADLIQQHQQELDTVRVHVGLCLCWSHGMYNQGVSSKQWKQDNIHPGVAFGVCTIQSFDRMFTVSAKRGEDVMCMCVCGGGG
jgi:hypothetical protein